MLFSTTLPIRKSIFLSSIFFSLHPTVYVLFLQVSFTVHLVWLRARCSMTGRACFRRSSSRHQNGFGSSLGAPWQVEPVFGALVPDTKNSFGSVQGAPWLAELVFYDPTPNTKTVLVPCTRERKRSSTPRATSFGEALPAPILETHIDPMLARGAPNRSLV
jgi:hypothetical protein